MTVREKFQAVQWQPNPGHPAVYAHVVTAGMDRITHPEIAHWLDEGKGSRGVIHGYDWHDIFGWYKVEPGDWLINRNGAWEVCPQDKFSERFEII